MSRPPARTSTLALIRAALLIGVLVMGGIMWLVRRQGGQPAAPVETLAMLRTLGFVWWGVALAGMLVLLFRSRRQRVGAPVPRLNIIGWTLAELPALHGAIYYLSSGDLRWYVNGLYLLLASFLLFPIRRAR